MNMAPGLITQMLLSHRSNNERRLGEAVSYNSLIHGYIYYMEEYEDTLFT